MLLAPPGRGFHRASGYMYRVSSISRWGRAMYVGEGVRKGELHRARGRAH